MYDPRNSVAGMVQTALNNSWVSGKLLVALGEACRIGKEGLKCSLIFSCNRAICCFLVVRYLAMLQVLGTGAYSETRCRGSRACGWAF